MAVLQLIRYSAVLQGHRCFVSKLDPFHPESNHTKIQLNQLEITKLVAV